MMKSFDCLFMYIQYVKYEKPLEVGRLRVTVVGSGGLIEIGEEPFEYAALSDKPTRWSTALVMPYVLS